MNNELLIDDDKKNFINKKSIIILLFFIILGIVTGIILSTYFINDANQQVDEWNENVDRWFEEWDNSSWWNNSNQTNTTNSSIWTQPNSNTSNKNNTSNRDEFTRVYNPYLEHVSTEDVIIPIISVILLTINSYILLGLNFVYIKIFSKTKSKYIAGLLLVLIPLLLVSLFFIRIVKSLFISTSFQINVIPHVLGFSINGVGGMMSILTIIEIIGLSILFYLSNE